MLTTGHSHEKGDDEELHFDVDLAVSDTKYLKMITLGTSAAFYSGWTENWSKQQFGPSYDKNTRLFTLVLENRILVHSVRKTHLLSKGTELMCCYSFVAVTNTILCKGELELEFVF